MPVPEEVVVAVVEKNNITTKQKIGRNLELYSHNNCYVYYMSAVTKNKKNENSALHFWSQECAAYLNLT